MIWSADELEILEYLKGWNGKFVPMVEICRRASGRQRYEGDKHWAKGLMTRLLDAKLVEVNERGHYRAKVEEKEKEKEKRKAVHQPELHTPVVVDENYFAPAPKAPEPEAKLIVDENYFAPPPDAEEEKWMSPQIMEILKKSGKKLAHKRTGKER